jgi:hypothetical protein
MLYLQPLRICPKSHRDLNLDFSRDTDNKARSPTESREAHFVDFFGTR